MRVIELTSRPLSQSTSFGSTRYTKTKMPLRHMIDMEDGFLPSILVTTNAYMVQAQLASGGTATGKTSSV